MDQWSIFSGAEVPRKNWPSTKNPALTVEKEDCQSDYRDDNQEADHWANIGAHGQRETILDRCDNLETWKAVRGYWDGSFKMWCGDQRS